MSILIFCVVMLVDIFVLIVFVILVYWGDVSCVGWIIEVDLLDGVCIDVEGIQFDLDCLCFIILLVECDGFFVVCVYVVDVDGKGYFGMFLVDLVQQGGGVGKQLMDVVEVYVVCEWNVLVMQMMVIDVCDELIVFYECCGYQWIGIKKFFLYGDECFGIFKCDDLCFEILEKLLVGVVV